MKGQKTKAIENKLNMPVYITIIRHGETDLNKEHRIRGWSDVPLSEDARPIIRKTGKELRGKLDCLVSSDLKRAHDTAKIISKEADIPIKEVSEDFRPWDVGHHTGEPQEKVYRYMADFARNKPSTKIEKGESFDDFKGRFLSAVKRIVKEYMGERVGIVTHHRGDRIFAAWHNEGFPKDLSVDLDIFLDSKGLEPAHASKPVKFHRK